MTALTIVKGDQVGGELEVEAYTPYFPSTVPLPFSVIVFRIGGLAAWDGSRSEW